MTPNTVTAIEVTLVIAAPFALAGIVLASIEVVRRRLGLRSAVRPAPLRRCVNCGERLVQFQLSNRPNPFGRPCWRCALLPRVVLVPCWMSAGAILLTAGRADTRAFFVALVCACLALPSIVAFSWLTRGYRAEAFPWVVRTRVAALIVLTIPWIAWAVIRLGTRV